MNVSTSPELQSYINQQGNIRSTASQLCTELRELGVVRVEAEYDGVGDSGQIESIQCFDHAELRKLVDVGQPLIERLDSLFYALMESRHSGWENGDGGNGTFRWNLADETFEHDHHQHYIESTSSYHEGLDDVAEEGV